MRAMMGRRHVVFILHLHGTVVMISVLRVVRYDVVIRDVLTMIDGRVRWCLLHLGRLEGGKEKRDVTRIQKSSHERFQ
jgi:hypothetical protein